MAEQQLVYKVACGRRDYRALPYSPLEKCDFVENDVPQICDLCKRRNKYGESKCGTKEHAWN